MVIYKTTNLVNGKQYIGRDSRNNPNYLGSGPLIKKAIKKYGKENFIKEIIEECHSFEQMVKREEYWLNYYDAGNNDLFYNLQNLGKGVQFNQETRKKIGEASRRRITSDETRKKISQATKGKNNPMFGKKHHDTTRELMRKKRIGKKASEETKSKLSEMGRGSNNWRYNRGYLFTAENNGNFKGYIVCVSGDYIGQRKTNKEWCDVLGIWRQNFRKHLNGQSYKNGIKGNFFKWEYEIK